MLWGLAPSLTFSSCLHIKTQTTANKQKRQLGCRWWREETISCQNSMLHHEPVFSALGSSQPLLCSNKEDLKNKDRGLPCGLTRYLLVLMAGTLGHSRHTAKTEEGQTASNELWAQTPAQPVNSHWVFCPAPKALSKTNLLKKLASPKHHGNNPNGDRHLARNQSLLCPQLFFSTSTA